MIRISRKALAAIDDGTMSKELAKEVLPHFDGSMSIAVFNCTDNGKEEARARIVKEFGADQFESEIAACTKSGTMEIFQHPVSKIRLRYAWYLAAEADQYHGRAAACEKETPVARILQFVPDESNKRKLPYVVLLSENDTSAVNAYKEPGYRLAADVKVTQAYGSHGVLTLGEKCFIKKE